MKLLSETVSILFDWSYFQRWHQQCEVLSFSVLCNPPADSFSFIQPAHWWIHCRNISSVSCRPTSPHLLTAWRPVRTTASQRYWHSVCQLLINKFNLIRRAVLVTWSPAWSIFKTVASVPSRIPIQATCSWPGTCKPSEKADKGAVTDKGADAAEKGADPVDKGRVDCLHEAFSSISKLFPWNHRHSPQTVQCSMQVD